ncbi:NAD(P)-binding protein [Aspergillus sclerotioniger CBS 115572]|uniref:NAD(P)-binding protein n=1 Tax=Aspergillus sclerotioniger CBS 115572 TaxID=1450535 RepID=A0A317WQS0_9EURO|nr:NAD(P)-binding protein [Aspergillus sclerotioniger CBS 115572]PWY88854.1 NAD(P)-binding protein [Aspergillus sclerotioniger CBS 115572]
MSPPPTPSTTIPPHHVHPRHRINTTNYNNNNNNNQQQHVLKHVLKHNHNHTHTHTHQPPIHTTSTPTPTIPWTPTTPQTRPLAIIGAGCLGRRIACIFSAAGHTVHLRDPSAKARTEALEYITTHMPEYTDFPLIPRPQGPCHTFSDLDTCVQNAWLVIESVPERLPLKIEVMGELDAKTPSDCILASNSSSFKTSFMVEKVRSERRPLICNMHFAMPPRIRAVELMTNGETDLQVLSFLTWVLDDCGMMPVTARKERSGLVRSHCLNTVT